MKYMGSKTRIAKDILPIILKDRKPGQFYVEPFCGGCNVIDKVEGKRIANDINPYLIRMWQTLLTRWDPPRIISREYYNDVRRCYKEGTSDYNFAEIGWVGFMGSYNGRFFDGGYSGHHVKINGGHRDYIKENIKNTLNQVGSLRRVHFSCSDYRNMRLPNEPCIIYCDPPYKGVKKYSYSIDHDEFWEWCRDIKYDGHKVFISEYEAPEDFTCVWEQPVKTAINQTITKNATEKLFTL